MLGNHRQGHTHLILLAWRMTCKYTAAGASILMTVVIFTLTDCGFLLRHVTQVGRAGYIDSEQLPRKLDQWLDFRVGSIH